VPRTRQARYARGRRDRTRVCGKGGCTRCTYGVTMVAPCQPGSGPRPVAETGFAASTAPISQGSTLRPFRGQVGKVSSARGLWTLGLAPRWFPRPRRVSAVGEPVFHWLGQAGPASNHSIQSRISWSAALAVRHVDHDRQVAAHPHQVLVRHVQRRRDRPQVAWQRTALTGSPARYHLRFHATRLRKPSQFSTVSKSLSQQLLKRNGRRPHHRNSLTVTQMCGFVRTDALYFHDTRGTMTTLASLRWAVHLAR
jgi:hypothetical protein